MLVLALRRWILYPVQIRGLRPYLYTGAAFLFRVKEAGPV